MVRTRRVLFRTWQDKANFLDGRAWVDARLPYVRAWARRVAMAHDPNDFEGIARDLFEYVQHKIKYVSDPASEEFSDAEQTMRQGFGDCDDKAELLVALLRSASSSFEAHIRPVLNDVGFAHVQVVMRFPRSYLLTAMRSFPGGARPDFVANPGGWIVAEVILRDAQLGDDIQDVPRARDGSLPLS